MTGRGVGLDGGDGPDRRGGHDPHGRAGHPGQPGQPDRRTRTGLVTAALAVQAAVVLAVGLDAPFAVRLPLGLLYAGAVPGFAVVGLLRLSEPITEAALSVAVSLLLATAVAQGLVWAGASSLGATLAVLGVVSTAGLAAQLRTVCLGLPAPAPGAGPSGPRRRVDRA